MSNRLHRGQPRDNQRQRLYDAEDVLRGLRVSPAAKRLLVDTERHDWLHVEDPNFVFPPGEEFTTLTHPDGSTEQVRRRKYVPMYYPNVKAVQDYIDAVRTSAWFIRRWGNQPLRYVPGQGSHGGYGRVTVSRSHRRSECVILHEIAHNLTNFHTQAYHGPEFAAVLLTLVRYQMGKEYSDRLRASYAEKRVKYRAGMSAVPKPSESRWNRAQAAKR